MVFFWVYQILWFFAPCFLRCYLIRRSRLSDSYLMDWNERFGKPYNNPVKNCIWIHAVSVGETRAAQSIIELLRAKFPDTPFLVTQMTPTGKITAQELYPFAQCRYLSYDKRSYVTQFLQEHQPKMVLFMETEIWPNFLLELAKRKIPTFLINARMSEKSFSGYFKVKSLAILAIQCFTKIFAQTEKDLYYFQKLGANRVEVTGNIKYDIKIKSEYFKLAQKFQQKLADIQRPVVVCGSTRVKDNINEAFLLLNEWKKHHSSALLVIVPRHPETFETIYEYSLQLGFTTVKYSLTSHITSEVHVVIGDSVGELMAYYLCADVVFVGGSLVDTGCHNIIEPISCEVSTIFGYSIYNFEQVCQAAIAAKCAIQIKTPQEWYQKTQELLEDNILRRNIQKNTQFFITQHQGVSQKIVLQLIKLV